MEKKIYNTVKTSLKNAGILFDVDEDNVICFGIKGEHTNFNVRLICDEKLELLIAIATCSLCVPNDKIDRMCRWIAEKNYCLTLGDFKLDTSDGELSFRISCPLDKGAVNEDIVTVAYSNALQVFDSNFESIIKAIYLDNGSGEN